MPKVCKCFDALSAGLINEPTADFIAFADSAAGTPASFIATIITATSLNDPPSCATTGDALGIASTISCKLVLVWFSTAFKKLIDSLN